MQILMDIPDAELRECLARAEKNGTTCEEEIIAGIRAGLVKAKAPDDKLSVTELFDRLAKNIKAIPLGSTFTINDVMGDLGISPSLKKSLGKVMAVEAIEQNGFIRHGKTQQNLSTYKRVASA